MHLPVNKKPNNFVKPPFCLYLIDQSADIKKSVNSTDFLIIGGNYQLAKKGGE